MTVQREVYKCSVCGNIVEVLYSGGGELVCCGKPMMLQVANAEDKASKEKHVPIIKGNVVAVGSVPHPMEEKHYIMWIEAESAEGETERAFLEPCDEPEAEFDFKVKSARAYCNLHGLWKSS
jgi:superoxide reductase